MIRKLLLVALVACSLAGSAFAAVQPNPTVLWAERWRDHVNAIQVLNEPWDWNYETRAELDVSDTKYLLELQGCGALLPAPDVEDYLNRLLREVHPGRLPDGYPGSLHVRVQRDMTPNAYVLSNGAIVVTTGLLTLARSEDEVRAVLAHELGHVYGDHHYLARRSKEARQAWGSILSAAVGIGAGVLAAQSGDASIRAQAAEIGVSATYMSLLISQVGVELAGFAYSRKQEKEADAAAQAWTQEYSPDTLAFARLLERIGTASGAGRGQRTSWVDDHPATTDRLAALGFGKAKGVPKEVDPNPSFDQHIAKLLTTQAQFALILGRYDDALAYTSRAIHSGWPDAGALLARATAIRFLNTEPDSLRGALELVTRAEAAGANKQSVYLERALIQLRLNDEAGALQTLERCAAILNGPACDPKSEIKQWMDATCSQLRLRGAKVLSAPEAPIRN